MIWLVLGCRGLDPFENDKPFLESVNGIENRRLFGFEEGIEAVPGEDLELVLVIDDPENQHVRVWWPDAPPGWEFDPDETSGVWHVPELAEVLEITAAFPTYYPLFNVVLEDTHPRDPQLADFYVPIFLPVSSDTGFEETGRR